MMRLYAWKTKVKSRRLNLQLFIRLLSGGGIEAHGSAFVTRTPLAVFKPAFLPSLASCLGQMHCIYHYHRHICLPGLTDVSAGKRWCCQVRGFPFSFIYVRIMFQSSVSCRKRSISNPTRPTSKHNTPGPSATASLLGSEPGPQSPN